MDTLPLVKLFVGRQPILDDQLKTFAYELLYRSGGTNRYDAENEVVSTSTVIANAFLALPFDRVLEGHRGFINFPGELLVAPEGPGLPPQSVVIEVLETVTPDDEVIAACRRLKRQGYQLALDDFVTREDYGPLIDLADYIKIDFLNTSLDDCRHLSNEFGKRGIHMLAEKIETREVLEYARGVGYRYFQGYFLARPEIIQGSAIPTYKWNALRLLAEINRPELDFDRLDRLIRLDVAVTRRLMRYLNSAAFAFSGSMTTLRHGLVVLGEREVRRWVTLAALPHLTTETISEVAHMSLYRARLCELIGDRSPRVSAAPECFMMGLFSMLDCMVGRPLSELLPELGLQPQILKALLGQVREEDPFRRVLDLCIACEAVDDPTISAQAEALELSIGSLTDLCLEAMKWVEDASGVLGYPH
ncbi:MAG: HDOD domain-containing protein [Bryobacteraceae bacterium]